MPTRILRSDAPAVAQVTRLSQPEASGQIALTILGSGKFLTFDAWSSAAVATAWNACTYPEFAEARASVSGADVLLTSKTAGRPFYVSATVNGNRFGNEIQAIIPVNVSGGTAVAKWLGQATDEFDPTETTAAELKALFEALPGGIVAADELTWTGPEGGPWTVEFGGRYAEQNVPLIEIVGTDLEGGVDAQNEIQRLIAGTSVTGTTFQIRRVDTLQTTDVLTIPVTASQVHTALTSIDYDTSCTGGPVTGSGEGSTEREMNYFAGYFYDDGTTLRSFNENGDQLGPIGLVAGHQSTGMLQFPAAVPQGTTILSATLRPLFANGYDAIPGVVVKAEASDNASWPANAAAAAAASLTTASSTFDINAGGPYAIDVTSVVQEIVNRVGWASGHKINFHLIPPPTTHTAQMLLTAGGSNPLVHIYLDIVTAGGVITIQWIGDDAATDIPLLLIVPSGGYAGAPQIVPVQDGHPAQDAELLVETMQQGGEALLIRDEVRSRGPNHWDDPLNWDCEDGSFLVPQWGDEVFVESGRVDLLYGLNQRADFVAVPALNELRLTDVHHLWIGQAVRVISTNTLPSPLSAVTTYYVVSIDGPYVQLSTTLGGAPVDLTNAGSGVHTLGVKLSLLNLLLRWTGRLGLPRTNAVGTAYFEYRERYLTLWCDQIKIGIGDGSGSSRVNLDTGTLKTILQAIASAGGVETGVNAVLWKGVHEDNEVEALGADLGLAVFPEETATCDVIKQRGGSVTIGRGVTAAGLDATSGTRKILGARIAGDIVSN